MCYNAPHEEYAYPLELRAKFKEGSETMIAAGILFIVIGVVGFLYTRGELNTLSQDIHAIGAYLWVVDTSTMEILNMVSVAVGVLGALLLIVGIIKMIKD
jgi:hypothetical protein